jgi:hypothetical protein
LDSPENALDSSRSPVNPYKSSPNDLKKPPNHLESSLNHLKKSLNHLESSPNHLEKSSNHLEKSPNHHGNAPNHQKKALDLTPTGGYKDTREIYQEERKRGERKTKNGGYTRRSSRPKRRHWQRSMRSRCVRWRRIWASTRACSTPVDTAVPGGRRLRFAPLPRTRTTEGLTRLRKEVKALREANEILKKAAAIFAPERPR